MSSSKKTTEHGTVKVNQTGDENRDPISGEPGAHPVGVGIGAAAGGAAAGIAGGALAGAMSGTAAGPIGTAVGAVVGAVAGGLAGKGIAESIDPTEEDTYWEQNYRERSYIPSGSSYDTYRPAYRYGWESRGQYNEGNFDQYETELARGWDRRDDAAGLGWDKARHAVRDAWNRVDERGRTASATRAEADPTIPGTCDPRRS